MRRVGGAGVGNNEERGVHDLWIGCICTSEHEMHQKSICGKQEYMSSNFSIGFFSLLSSSCSFKHIVVDFDESFD